MRAAPLPLHAFSFGVTLRLVTDGTDDDVAPVVAAWSAATDRDAFKAVAIELGKAGVPPGRLVDTTHTVLRRSRDADIDPATFAQLHAHADAVFGATAGANATASFIAHVIRQARR